jgi:redox-sensitive bicupin YhaK (pirin superfamily)
MITLRKANTRRHSQHPRQEIWLTFYQDDPASPLAQGFGALELFNEHLLPPGAGVPRHAHRDTELLTYVSEGALSYEDSTGRSGVIHTGEFQCMTVGRKILHSERNASRSDWAHVFRVSLRTSQVGLESNLEQKRFSTAERRGGLCVVASPDARRKSLRIHQDALMYSALLDPGQHVIYELAPGRGAWLHLVQGAVTLGDVSLTTGDGAGVTAERAVSLTAWKETEILLFDIEP